MTDRLWSIGDMVKVLEDWEMSNSKLPTFEINPAHIGSGCEVLVTWPGYGPQEHISFDTEVQAQAWIDNESPAWIAKHPKSK